MYDWKNCEKKLLPCNVCPHSGNIISCNPDKCPELNMYLELCEVKDWPSEEKKRHKDRQAWVSTPPWKKKADSKTIHDGQIVQTNSEPKIYTYGQARELLGYLINESFLDGPYYEHYILFRIYCGGSTPKQIADRIGDTRNNVMNKIGRFLKMWFNKLPVYLQVKYHYAFSSPSKFKKSFDIDYGPEFVMALANLNLKKKRPYRKSRRKRKK